MPEAHPGASGELNLKVLFQRARQAHVQQRFEEAERGYRQILSIDPGAARVVHLLAVLHNQTGRIDDAIALSRESIRIGGPVFDFVYLLAAVLVKAGDVDGARRTLVSALDSPPAERTALAALGEALRDIGAADRAEVCFRKILEEDPTIPQAHNALGGLFLARGEVPEALAAFDQALRLAPGFVTAAYNRREALRRLGRLPDPCSQRVAPDPTATLRCAVVTPVGPGHAALLTDCADSVARAVATNPGCFAEVWHEIVEDQHGHLGRSKARNLGVDRAAGKKADFIFFLDADDIMSPLALITAAPYLHDYDAIWGLIASFHARVDDAVVRADQVWCTTACADVLLAPPVATLQMGHFVRTSVAVQHPFDETRDTGEDFDYYLRVWSGHRCIKLPEVLFFNRRWRPSTGPRSATGRQWVEAVQTRIAGELSRRPVSVRFEFDQRTVSFRIKDPRDAIQRYHVAGSFFEARELRFLRGRIGRGARIVDVGANVGNHAVFFGLYMEPASLLVIEPNPTAIELLGENLAANGLHAVDCSRLGVGAGNVRGRYALVHPPEDNLGATSLTPARNGDIEVLPLDDLIQEPVDFIKIDVEQMEMDVLRGARGILARYAPILVVEVMNRSREAFTALVDDLAYAIETEFPFTNATNFLIAPASRP